MSAVVSQSQYQSQFTDPYSDLVLSQVLKPQDTLSLSGAEFQILMAAVRSEILTSPEIKKILAHKVDLTLAELRAARQHFPQKGGA